MLVEYAEYLPVTVRQVYYRLVARYGLVKGTENYMLVVRMLARMRRTTRPEFHVPFESIRDDSSTDAWPRTDTPESFWTRVSNNAANYRRDRQEGQPTFIEVWCRRDGPAALAGHRPVRDSVESGGGVDSLSLKHERAERIAERWETERQPTTVLYLGDLDKWGLRMWQALTEDVPELALPHSRHVDFVRIALTDEQVAEHDIPPEADKPGQYPLEALDPVDLRSDGVQLRRGAHPRRPRRRRPGRDATRQVMLKLLGAHLAVRGCPPTPADIRDLASMLSAEPSDARRAHHPRTRI